MALSWSERRQSVEIRTLVKLFRLWVVWALLVTPAFALSINCPPQGDAHSARIRVLNRLKNRFRSPSRIDQKVTLARVLASGNDRERWKDSEAAQVTGYVLAVYEGGVETANCRAHGEAHRDTHIEIALKPDVPETGRMIVEVTPRWRAKMEEQGADWSTPSLRNRLIGQRVTFTGWMLFDFEHARGSEHTDPGNREDWRATAWEIHPVTGIRIDKRPPRRD